MKEEITKSEPGVVKNELKKEIKSDPSTVKSEKIKGERGIKSDPDGKNTNDEESKDFDCYINKVDHSHRKIDFSALPEDVVKSDLLNQGIRVCNLTRKKLAQCIEDTWLYRKRGEIPDRFQDSSDDEEHFQRAE
jgi:hypothetical protein